MSKVAHCSEVHDYTALLLAMRGAPYNRFTQCLVSFSTVWPHRTCTAHMSQHHSAL